MIKFHEIIKNNKLTKYEDIKETVITNTISHTPVNKKVNKKAKQMCLWELI